MGMIKRGHPKNDSVSVLCESVLCHECGEKQEKESIKCSNCGGDIILSFSSLEEKESVCKCGGDCKCGENCKCSDDCECKK